MVSKPHNGIMKFNPNFDFGQVVTFIGYALGAAALYFGLSARIDKVEASNQMTQIEVKALKEAQSSSDQKINDMQKTLHTISTDLAFVRGRLADSGARKP